MNKLVLVKMAPLVGLLLGAVAVLPLFALSFYNHPSSADDYCFADTAVRFGFWGGQKLYYDGWTGRYFSNMLVHGNPLVWGWYDGFRLLPALNVLGLLAALGALVNELLRGESVWTRMGVVGLLFFLYVLGLPSVEEGFFWFAATTVYNIPTAMTLYLIAVMIRWYRLPGGWLKSLTIVWASFLVFATVGSGEPSMIVLLLLLGSVFGYLILFRRRFDGFLLTLIGVGLVSAWLLFRAPGNALRMGGNPQAGNLIWSVMASAGWLAQTMPGWLAQTAIPILSVLYLPLGRRLVRANASTRVLFTAPAGLVTLAYVGMLMATVFPYYYGVGIPPVPRIVNLTYFLFLIGWFYTLTVWLGFPVISKIKFLDNQIITLILSGAVLVWIGFSALHSTTLRMVYLDLLRGQAAQYDREMTERHQRLMTAAVTGDTLRIQPISVQPQSLFLEDIRVSPAFLWNKCQASYYGHQAIVLDTTATTAR